MRGSWPRSIGWPVAANPSLARHPALDDWLSIGADGRIVVRTGKVDIGQRISTALALIAAEELEVEVDRIVVAPPETGAAPDEGITSGSYSMMESGEAVRRAATTARRRLLSLAAAALDADPSSLEIDDGTIRSRAANRSTSYWALMDGARFGVPVDADAPVKPPDALRWIGRRIVPRDVGRLVDGKARFVHDMTMPGMVHARVVRPPRVRASLERLDPAVCRRIEDAGARLARDGSFLAVAHADEYAAIEAARRLAAAATWRPGDGLDARDARTQLTANERVSLPVVDGAPRRAPVPPPAEPPPDAVATLCARFDVPYRMHAPIGPSAALALRRDGRLTVWTHSQGIYVLRASMAEALALDVEAVRVIHAPGAGCYGHNGADDAAFEAALIACALPGAPVLLKWTREDEHAWAPCGTCAAMELSASLDRAGRVIAWSHETYGDSYAMRPRPEPDRAGPARLLASRYRAAPLAPPPPPPNMARHVGNHRNLEPLYTFPDPRLVKHLVRGLPLRTSALRSLGAYGNVFAIESFMDDLAEAAGADPVGFRLRHLADERAKAVLNAAAAWLSRTAADAPAGCGRGIGFAQYKNLAAYAAVAVELEVTDAAEIRLRRAAVAADAGQIVDPNGLTAQLEGGLLQAASWTLYERVDYDEGGVTGRDWDGYPILRFDNVPEIETLLIDRPGAPFLGAGEAAAGPTAGAIANAVKDATGLRLRSTPFTPDALRAAALA